VIASKNWTLNAAAAARKKFGGGFTRQSTTSTPRKFGEIRRRRGLRCVRCLRYCRLIFVLPAHNGSVLNKLDPVTADEAHKLLSSSLPKSSNMDIIPTCLVLRCQSVFDCTLANLSFSEGRFPGEFKQAPVTTLLNARSLDKSLPSNYRPISNVNFISKVLERLFLSRFQPHILGFSNFNRYRLHIGQAVPLRLPCSFFLIAYIPCPTRGDRSYSFH